MSHVDEGLIHAWLEDQLPPDEAARIERLVATDAAWRAAVAEARGLIAATARVIGALDSAPSAVGENLTARTERTGRTKGTGVSWARSPWMRVAAAVVLVAGISGVLFTRGGDVTNAVAPEKDSFRKESREDARPAAVAEAPAVSRQTAPSATRPPQVAQLQARRDSSAPERGRAATIVVPPMAASPPPVAAVAANEIASAAKATTGAADAIADSRAAGIGAGRGGGRGGRGAARVAPLVEQGVVRSEFAKTLAVPDSVFGGCWMPVDTSRRERQRQASESAAAESMILRFTQPVVTDLAGALPLAVSAPRPQAGTISALQAAPARARVQNASPRMKDDSTLVAEWLNPDGRTTQLTFRLRGDTLRGTTNAISGDLVIAGPAFVAVRTQCSQ